MNAGSEARIALCFTVLNEADSVDGLFASIAAQSRPPNEIVVTDGGSTDGTVEQMERWRDRGLPITVLRCKGANISEGRNRAIERSLADVIAVTDAGVRLGSNWLDEITNPFRGPNPPDVVSGFFEADPKNPFELALGATTLPTIEEIGPKRFLPSSRSVAFTRAAWQRVGGYPEWLDYCEDLVYDLALRDAGFRFGWAPRAIVHFRPRPTLGAFFLQYFRYARGDGKADLWRTRHAIRYATYLALPILLGLSVRHALWSVPILLGVAAYLRRPYERLFRLARGADRSAQLTAGAYVPVIRFVGDIAKMAGYPVGVSWRARRHGFWRPAGDSSR